MINEKVLGQLLLMQSVLNNLPNKDSIFSFVCSGLKDIPGVLQVYYTHKSLKSNKEDVCFELKRATNHFGTIQFKIYDLDLFNSYIAYLENFMFMLEVILEEREQLKKISAHEAELETRVNERTKDLKIEIEEHKKAVIALKKSESQFRNFFENAADALILAEFDSGYILDVNIAATNLMDLSREELIGMHQSELHPKSTKKFNTETYSIHKNEVENNKPIIAVENKVIRRDGTEIAVEILASKVNYKGKKCLLGTFRDITIRKQSNIKIEESEKKYRQLFENMSQGAFYQSADGILIDVNKAALEMLGLSYDQFIGNTSSHPDWNVIGPDGKLLIPEKYASMLALRTGTAVTNLEMGVFRPKTQDYVWIIANAIPQFKPGETKPYQVFVTLHNITERKRIEDVLKSLSTSYASLKGREFFETISKHIASEMSLDYVFVGQLNKKENSISAIGGYGKGKPLGEISYRIKNTPCEKVIDNKLCIYPSNVQSIFPKDTLLTEMGIEAYIGAPLTDNENNSVGLIVGLHSKPITNSETIKHFFNYFRDRVVAEMQRDLAEEKLIKEKIRTEVSEAKLANIIDGTLAGTWEWNIQTGETNFNERWANIIGYTLKELEPISINTWQKFSHPDDLEKSNNELQKHFNNEIANYENESRMKHKNGSWIWVLDRGKVSKWTDDGKPLLMYGTHLDITESKNAEILITDKNAELKKTNKKLKKAKDKAEESDRLKTSFLANMSHEIRTPLNSIMGFASLLPNEVKKQLIDQYSQIIIQNSEQLVSIIDSIVLYSKLQTGLFVYNPKNFVIHDLLLDILNSFKLPKYQKNVQLRINDTTNKELQITTDYDKIRQILTNLTSNAFKYTPSGLITIGYTTKNQSIELYIQDSGIGIPSKERKHIFDRFYRGSNVETSAIRGTGLGLSIVKELVELLGGTIWVKSNKGTGTTFFIDIPNKKS